MAKITDAEIDQAIPSNGTPNRANTNALLKNVADELHDIRSLSSFVNPRGFLRVGAIGDSIVRNNYSPSNSGGDIGLTRIWTGFGAWVFLSAALTNGNCYADIYSLEGYSGFRTDQILSSALGPLSTEAWGVSSDIGVGLQSRKPDIVFDMSGTNDLTFYENLSDPNGIDKTVAGRRGIWSYIRQNGGVPIAMSLLPRDDGYGLISAAYNDAIKAAAETDGVVFVNAYDDCANPDGTWRTGYIYHNGSDDPTGLHPSWLGTQVIARLAAEALENICLGSASIPRIVSGSPSIYTIPYRVGPGNYYEQFIDGSLGTLSGVLSRYDPDGDSSFQTASQSIDLSQDGQTVEFIKPSSNDSRYADWTTDSNVVVGGQEYLVFADVQFSSFDSFSTLIFGVTDNTYQPLQRFAVSSGDALNGYESDVMRIVLTVPIPPNVTRLRPHIVINRSSGGLPGGNDTIKVANLGCLRIL